MLPDFRRMIPLAKSGLTGPEAAAAGLLRRVFPDGARPLMGRMRAGAAPRGWLALALVASIDTSQYDIMLDMARAAAGLPGPLAALALSGRGFHGHRGRPWLAERGNLHLCCALPVDLDARTAAGAVPALAAVSVCDALRRCAPGLEPRLKWVNDVLLDGAKIAGVLSAAQTRGDRLLALTFGMGVNVAVVPAVAPTLFVPRAACLNEHPAGRGVRVDGLALALLEALSLRIAELREAGPLPVVRAYRRACGDIGRRIGVWAEGTPDAADPKDLPPPVAAGRLLSLTDSLSLVIEGASSCISSGRLAHLDRPRAAGRDAPDALPEQDR